jgi:hypothetical protein
VDPLSYSRGIVILMLASCAHDPQPAARAPNGIVDSAAAAAAAIAAVRPAGAHDSLRVSDFVRDSHGFDITVEEVPPAGTVRLGGGGRVRVAPDGKVKSVELYQ